ncbi:MAG: hypothetical protein EXS03_04130 [Phycisphaerales bacterium]|nr:hypothetical protein [Phycisphaerales bacterium]
MALVASARPSRIAWFIGYIVLCAGFGLWGAYDYWVRIPREEAEFAQFNEIKDAKEALELKAQNGSTPLTPTEIASYERRTAEFQRYAEGAPEPVPVYDRPLQLWVYVVGCGILGTPYFAWSLAKLKRRRTELTDRGDLFVDGQTLDAIDIQGIDMSRWMSKSIATVQGRGGQRLVLDDYLLKDTQYIVGRIAHRYHPDLWKEDATKVEVPDEDGTPAQSSATGAEATRGSDGSSA